MTIKTELKALKADGTKLERKVINVLLDQGSSEEIENFMKDVIQHGCVSGIVGELIYYNDTLAFYEKYKRDINNLLKESMEEFGLNSPSEIFKTWENEDPFAEEESNQNLLAWYGFEVTVSKLVIELDI